MNDSKFAKGDVARLKSGGPLMTVAHTKRSDDRINDRLDVKCILVNQNGEMYAHWFNEEVLEKVYEDHQNSGCVADGEKTLTRENSELSKINADRFEKNFQELIGAFLSEKIRDTDSKKSFLTDMNGKDTEKFNLAEKFRPRVLTIKIENEEEYKYLYNIFNALNKDLHDFLMQKSDMYPYDYTAITRLSDDIFDALY